MLEHAPKNKFDDLVEEMKLKNFHYLKIEHLITTTFKKDTKLFTEEQTDTIDTIKKKYEELYPELEIEIVLNEKGTSCYVFGKIK